MSATITEAERVCRDCNESKPLSDFYVHSNTGNPYSRCKSCRYAQTQAWRADNKELLRRRNRERYHNEGGAERKRQEKRLAKYGLTQAAYESLLEEQGFVCPICLEPFANPDPVPGGSRETASRWDIASVDHDHDTGRVRGILHRRCNLALELLLSEDETRRARLYLQAGGE